jgi:hypothetical protein
MVKRNWLYATALAIAVMGGMSVAWAQTRLQTAPPLSAGDCSHKGGPCSWSGDCCMNENLYCDDSSKTCKTQ